MLRKKRTTLTAQAQAAILAGVPVEQAVAESTAAAPAGDPPPAGAPAAEGQPAGDPPAETPPAEATNSDGEPGDNVAPAGDPPAETPAASAEDSTVTLLLDKVGDLQMQLSENKVALNTATAGLESAMSLQASFMQLVRDRISSMNIALGGTALNLEAVSAEQLLLQHEATSTELNTRYPVGGRAEVNVDDDDRNENVVPIMPAAVRATSFNKGG